MLLLRWLIIYEFALVMLYLAWIARRLCDIRTPLNQGGANRLTLETNRASVRLG